ncbi:MAG: peptide synthase [Puniceicoccaceae bacterium]|nr:MAG: peptide synthase [Puniceicoccaceae bacterium]
MAAALAASDAGPGTRETANISRHLPRVAGEQPANLALRVPSGRGPGGVIRTLDLSFAELDAEADAWAWRLEAAGIRRSSRVLLMVRPGLPLIALCFALFKTGAVPVVIDPGMGLRGFLRSVRRTGPEFLVGIRPAVVLARLFRRSFAGLAGMVRVGGGERISDLDTNRPAPFAPAPTRADETAAVLFTSGSTGPAKGVVYTHGMFEAQVRMIREAYRIEPGEVDLPMLPVFALFNPALGMTTVVPEINPSRPATVRPENILGAIRQFGVTNSFGSPTLWRKIAAAARVRGERFEGVRRILMAGAPVPPGLMAVMREVFPKAELHSPYGATEVLPVSTIEAAEVLGETAAATLAGRGTCVGRPLEGVRVRIVAASRDPLPSWNEARVLPAGEVGEVVVHGPSVTRSYDRLPEATARAKIMDGEEVWHRMGDLGRLDENGRLWFCGRLVEAVEAEGAVFHTDCCEAVFNPHPAVARTALIGWSDAAGRLHPVLAVEPERGHHPRWRTGRLGLAGELRALGRQQPQTEPIRRFFFVRSFPVDVRHNAKIHRLALARRLAGKTPLEVS